MAERRPELAVTGAYLGTLYTLIQNPQVGENAGIPPSESAYTLRDEGICAVPGKPATGWRRAGLLPGQLQIRMAQMVEMNRPSSTGGSSARTMSSTCTRANPATAISDDQAMSVPPPVQTAPI